MSILNPGTGTVKSTTLEGAIDELTSIIAMYQKDASKNPQNAALVNAIFTSITGEVTYDIAIPLQAVTSGTGILYSVMSPFVGVTYTSSGDLIGGSALQDLYNCLTNLETFESNPTRNPGNEARVNFDIASSPWRATISLTLSAVMSVGADGSQSRKVNPYLN